MNRWIVPGFGGCAAAAVIAVLWQAGSPSPQPAAPSAPGAGAASAAQGEDWGSPDGGAVVIKPGGTYSILVEDAGDHSSVFSEGRVVGRTGALTEEHSYRLKPTTPGQESWVFEVDAKPDGTAELYVSKGSARHLVTTLKK
jgi:hypothetical protein